MGFRIPSREETFGQLNNYLSCSRYSVPWAIQIHKVVPKLNYLINYYAMKTSGGVEV
jgi:hypothetical protein